MQKVLNEDCLDTFLFLDANSLDLILTSPPYGKLRIYNGFSFNFQCVAKESYRTLKPGGVLVWVVSDQVVKGSETGDSFRQALYFMECGFNLHDTMIWDKKDVFGTAGNPASRYQQAFEYIFVFTKGKPKTFNPITLPVVQKDKVWTGTLRRDRRSNIQTDCLKKRRDINNKDFKIVNNIFTYPVGFNKTTKDKIAFKQPAIFPDALARDVITTWTNKGDLVYDCFGGSGTTAKQAYLLDRHFIISEVSTDYCEIIHERLKLAEIEKYGSI